LASAELDRRLSAVSGAGLKIASEEDKQYLANIATMTKEVIAPSGEKLTANVGFGVEFFRPFFGL